MKAARVLGRLLISSMAAVAIGCGGSSGPGASPSASPTPRGLSNLKHVIIVIQENHSFDNYFGVLPYAGSTAYFTAANPYHTPSGSDGCEASDSTCVDALTCSGTTPESCSNFNYVGATSTVPTTHTTDYCPGTPNHDWAPMHQKANFCDPNSPDPLNNGFAEVDAGHSSRIPMTYYNEEDLPYYYAVAETFAISDRHFASLIGPTLSDRMYTMAATSFGHLDTDQVNDSPPGPPGYQPITGSIFDLLDKYHRSWAEYYECGDNGVPPRPYAQLFRYEDIPNFVHLSNTDPSNQFPEFAAATQGSKCSLPDVSYVSIWNHEHPPYSVQAGEHDVSVLINYLRTGPCWKDSIMFITYDEGGGNYDHVLPPAVVSPDGIPPGECADLSNPPSSLVPGGGANCSSSLASQTSLESLTLPGEAPADFTQLGFRIPLLAISPFAKPHYVSHVVSEHSSMLKLIEERFTRGKNLNRRDAASSDLSDMFDFVHSPSANAEVSPAIAPTPVVGGKCGNPLPTPAATCSVLFPLPTPSPTPPPAATPTPVVCTIPTPSPTPAF